MRGDCHPLTHCGLASRGVLSATVFAQKNPLKPGKTTNVGENNKLDLASLAENLLQINLVSPQADHSHLQYVRNKLTAPSKPCQIIIFLSFVVFKCKIINQKNSQKSICNM